MTIAYAQLGAERAPRNDGVRSWGPTRGVVVTLRIIATDVRQLLLTIRDAKGRAPVLGTSVLDEAGELMGTIVGDGDVMRIRANLTPGWFDGMNADAPLAHHRPVANRTDSDHKANTRGSGHCEVCLSGALHRHLNWRGRKQAHQAGRFSRVLCQQGGVSDRHGTLRWIAALGLCAVRDGAPSQIDGPEIRQSVQHPQQE